jgi:hypothetical protein
MLWAMVEVALHLWMTVVHHYIITEVGCLCGITVKEMERKAQGKGVFVGHFISLV